MATCKATTVPDRHPAPNCLRDNDLDGETSFVAGCPDIAVCKYLEKCKNSNLTPRRLTAVSGPLCAPTVLSATSSGGDAPPPMSAHAQKAQKVPHGCAYSERRRPPASSGRRGSCASSTRQTPLAQDRLRRACRRGAEGGPGRARARHSRLGFSERRDQASSSLILPC